MLVLQAPTKKNPQRLLAILLDGNKPWYLTKDSDISNAAQEIFKHFMLARFNISLNDFTSFITSNQNKFDLTKLSKRLMLSDFSFMVVTIYSINYIDTNTLVLIRKQMTNEKVAEFYDSKLLSYDIDGAMLITKYGFDTIEILEFINLFNEMI